MRFISISILLKVSSIGSDTHSNSNELILWLQAASFYFML